MKKMKLKNQIVLVNVVIIAGLVYQYMRGLSILAIVFTGILMLALANLVFFIRLQKEKNMQ